VTFKSLKQFSIESNQPLSMHANTPRLDIFNRFKTKVAD